MTTLRLRTAILTALSFISLLGAAPGEEPGIFVAAGHGLHRMSSDDGRLWQHHVFEGEPKHNQNDLAAIAAGNGVCVVVGGYFRSNIYTTKDGIEWNSPDFNIGVLSGVLFRDDHFYVFGQGARVARSADGMTWEKIGETDMKDHLKAEADELGLEKSIKSNIRMWREAGGVYVGAGDNGFLICGADFEDWQYPDRIEPHARLKLESDGETFVVAGKTLNWSTDGKTWTRADVPGLAEYPLPGKEKFRNIVHDGERFIATTRDQAWESPDGRQWTEITGATFPNVIATLRPDLYYSFQTYWKYTEELLLSTDQGKTWEPVTIPAPVGITCMIHLPDFPEFD